MGSDSRSREAVGGGNETKESRETKKFKAEVKQVLDIVVNSLYTHREIFIRELISNASDALEKMRHEALVLENYADRDVPLEIRIETDRDRHVFTITDTGVGMTRDELVNNLGTIARSGTREFLESVRDRESLGSEIIGKFGVGFYSAFMVAKEVRVRTRSFRPNAAGYEWVSDGSGNYRTTVEVVLRDDAREFEDEDNVRSIIKKYSNFVSFPILVGGEKVNTIQAIWLKSASEVKEEEYREFFKFISNSNEEPLSTLHISADAPIQLHALLYVPATNLERFGFMKLKPSVNLYIRKILIQQHTDKLLPDYMRFVTGVVDSPDLPLNISRETLQDNMVFRKMGKFLTKRVIRHLKDEAAKRPGEYAKIWEKFGIFIKEGVTVDLENRNDLAKLLRFRSSKTGDGTYVSFDDYIGRMKEEQKHIYYINGRSREEIENGPYMETFRKRDVEVLYLYEAVDDFVMSALAEYDGKKLVSADSADIELPPEAEETREEGRKPALTSEEVLDLASWMKETIGDGVKDVRESKRIMDRPAIVVNPDTTVTTAMRRVMKAAGRDFLAAGDRILEINPKHPIIVTLKKLRDGDADRGFLQSCVRQIYDNALAEAGLLDDPKSMVDRVYAIMERALEAEKTGEE